MAKGFVLIWTSGRRQTSCGGLLADLAQRKCNCLGRDNNQTMLTIVKKKTHYRLVFGMSHMSDKGCKDHKVRLAALPPFLPCKSMIKTTPIRSNIIIQYMKSPLDPESKIFIVKLMRAKYLMLNP